MKKKVKQKVKIKNAATLLLEKAHLLHKEPSPLFYKLQGTKKAMSEYTKKHKAWDKKWKESQRLLDKAFKRRRK